MFLGLFELGSTLAAAIPITVADVPLDPSGGNPTFRVYEGDTLIANGVGTLTKMDTGVITGATNATPIVITETAHGLETGNVVTITNVGGNTNANATHVITKLSSSTYSLATAAGASVAGNAAYTSGGVRHLTGLYMLSLSLLAGSGFEVGKTYQVVINFTNSSTAYAKTVYFSVT